MSTAVISENFLDHPDKKSQKQTCKNNCDHDTLQEKKARPLRRGRAITKGISRSEFQDKSLGIPNGFIVSRSQDAVELTLETRLGLCIVLHVTLNGIVSLPR